MLAMTDTETLDSAYESAVEDYTNVAHGGNKSKGKLDCRNFIEKHVNLL